MMIAGVTEFDFNKLLKSSVRFSFVKATLVIILISVSCLYFISVSSKSWVIQTKTRSWVIQTKTRPWVKDINVLDYGAAGDGYTNDSQAFSRAWDVTCKLDIAGSVNMIIPKGMTFLLYPILFKGPCKPSNITIQILGTIISPTTTETWKKIDPTQWLAFKRVTGLIIDGKGIGIIHGRGTNWWSQSCRYNHNKDCTLQAPTSIKFISCYKCYLRNIRFIDGANTHISIDKSEWFTVTDVKIRAPKTSPNTDGIHIKKSKHVFIDRSDIQCGDDCISIGDQTSDIRITNINCGPGHGISVGSLGKRGSYIQVENILVSHVNFYQTTNGVRIKTWRGATGYARGITFEYINFTTVQNPIFIDQYYCNKLHPSNCRAVEHSKSGVHISDVVFRNASGTSSTKLAVRLNCSQYVACTGILLESIQLTSTQYTRKHRHRQERVTSSCTNAHGSTKGKIQPAIPCLSHR